MASSDSIKKGSSKSSQAQNYTPVSPEKLKKKFQKPDKINTILIVIAILTAGVLAMVLWVLIKKTV